MMRSMFGPIEQISSYRSRHDVLKSGAMLSKRFRMGPCRLCLKELEPKCSYQPSHHLHITSHHPSHHLHITSHIKSPWPPRAAKKHCSVSIVSHKLPNFQKALSPTSQQYCIHTSKEKWLKVSLGRHLSANAAELGENGDLHHMHITSHQITITSHHITSFTSHYTHMTSLHIKSHITSHHIIHHITSHRPTSLSTSPLHHLCINITSHHKSHHITK